MVELTLLQAALVLFPIGGLIALLSALGSPRLSAILAGSSAAMASLLTAASGLLTLLHQSFFTLALPGLHLPFVTPKLTVDPLAAVFVMLIGLAGSFIAVYSIGYVQAEYQKKPIGLLGALHHVFMLAMLLVVLASDALSFLIAWECMALVSFTLVVFDTRSEESRRAGFLYLIMTHIGTACLLGMYLLLAHHSGSLTFASFTAPTSPLTLAPKSLLFGLAIVGFGTKAGLIPLHGWLPEAHPAAPSHVSALMSGVMLKTSVYSLLRCMFDFLAPFPEWWGILLATVALFTALFGITYASVENDFKRLLAYSSIENMGIIFFAVGLAMTFSARQEPVWAGLFLTAALFHSLNHAVFKSLLFMTAGAVLSATHTRLLQGLGGLIHKMPVTAVLFLVGALSISALPPLNGFVSEWLIFQGLIFSTQHTSEFLRVFLPLSAALLGLTGAVATVTFVKLFSGVFLAMPRSHHAQHIREVSPVMLIGMTLPALTCLGLGLTPTWTLPVLQQAVTPLWGMTSSMPVNGFSSYAPPLVLLVLLAGIGLATVLPQLLGKRTAFRKEITWSCGVTPAPEFEYTPAGFTQPLEVVFAKCHATVNAYHRYLYLPLANSTLALARRISTIQTGKIQIYLAYMLLALLGCLLWIKQ